MKHLKRFENSYFEEEEMDDVPMNMSVEDKFADEASELFNSIKVKLGINKAIELFNKAKSRSIEPTDIKGLPKMPKRFNENFTTYSSDLTTDEKDFLNDLWDLVVKYKDILSSNDIRRLLKDYDL